MRKFDVDLSPQSVLFFFNFEELKRLGVRNRSI